MSGEQLNFEISEALSQSSRTSVRRLSRDTGASVGTVHKSLKAMGYKALIPRLTQELIGDDFDRRKEFCEEILQLTADDPNFLS